MAGHQGITLNPATITRDALEAMRLQLAAAGIEKPRLEAELLLSNALGIERGPLLARLSEPLGVAAAGVQTALTRRLTREPLAYIIGYREFYGRRFIIEPGVLVPRPETEKIIDEAKSRLERQTTGWAIEVGCGSGCIAVTLALEFPALRIVATDIDPVALKVTRLNAEKFGVGSRIRLLRADALSAVVSGPRFVLAVSNPPYIDPAERESLQPEIRDFEPDNALYSGHGGLAFARALLPGLHSRLKPGGVALLEFGEGQGQTLAEVATNAGFGRVELIDDMCGVQRTLAAQIEETNGASEISGNGRREADG